MATYDLHGALGFDPGIDDHTLIEKPAPHGYGTPVVECSCGGWSTYVRPRKDGTAGTKSRREWREHMDNAMCDPNKVSMVGSIKMKQCTHELSVCIGTSPALPAYIAGSGQNMQRWATYSFQRYKWAIIKRTTSANKVRLSIAMLGYNSERDAILGAQKLLAKAERDGFQTTGADKRIIPQTTALTITVSPADLVERALAAKDSRKPTVILATIDEIDSILSAVPILTSMKQQLQASLRVTGAA